MKMPIAAAVLLFAPLAANAACAPTDFAIQDFKPQITAVGSSARLHLAGQLVNNCASASAAQIRIEAKDADGKVLQSKQGWPAGTSNLGPGSSAKFDLGRLFRYEAAMASYTVSVVDVRTW